MSIVIGSPKSIFFSVGTACGFDEFFPDATIGSNDIPSAPCVLKNFSISNAISYSVCPTFIKSNK